MKTLVFGDVHANIEALEAVLQHCGEVDAVLCLGDLIDYGPNPDECVSRIRELPNLTCLVGNHDLAVLGLIPLDAFNPHAQASADWTQKTLSGEAREYLQSLSPMLSVDGCLLAHGSPLDPVWEYLESPWQADRNFAAFDDALCFVGHTHIPRVFEACESKGKVLGRTLDDRMSIDLEDATRRIINPGGVGQPRDGDPRAAYAIWDKGVITFYRVAYPLERTQRKILDAGLPESLARRLAVGM